MLMQLNVKQILTMHIDVCRKSSKKLLQDLFIFRIFT